MRQRGRKSPATLVALNVNSEQPKLTAPSSKLTAPQSLNADERALFGELVDACDASHFRESDLPLLISYIQATLISRGAAHDPDRIALWEKATRMQATLATRLRLSPQSRIDPKTLGRQQPPPGPRPWDPVE
jgi:hypothetical protein